MAFTKSKHLWRRSRCCDSLEIEPANAFEFHCDEPGLAGDDNLVVRAARLFFSETNREPKVRLTLRKKIPHGAGLGGGSSDAAAALRGLNRFFDARLSSETLSTLAAQLGSDVPFFVNETAATCSGRGEIVMPAPLPVPLDLLLLKPEFGVPSAWAYSRWQATREARGRNLSTAKIRRHHFCQRSGTPGFREICFSCADEIVVPPTIGSWRCVNVGIRFDDFCGFASERGWRFGCEARKVRARSPNCGRAFARRSDSG